MTRVKDIWGERGGHFKGWKVGKVNTVYISRRHKMWLNGFWVTEKFFAPHWESLYGSIFFSTKNKKGKCQMPAYTSNFILLRRYKIFATIERFQGAQKTPLVIELKSSRGSRLAVDKSGSSSYLSPLKLDHPQNVVGDTILCKAHFFCSLKCTNSLSLVLPFTHAK